MVDTGKGSKAMKERMTYVRSFKKVGKEGKMSPKRTVKAASPRRTTRRTRKSPAKKEEKTRKSPMRRTRENAMTMKTYA